MRTLFIAPQVPWPLDVGSKIRIYNLLASYSRLGPVTLVCLAQNSAEAQVTPHLRNVAEAVYAIPLPSRVPSGKRGALAQIAQPLPRIVREFYCAQLGTQVESLLDSGRFDAVHIERLFMVENLTAVARGRAGALRMSRILDIDDLESSKLWRALSLEPSLGVRKYLLMLEYLKLRRYERRVLSWFDLSLVCSETDRVRVEARPPFPAVQVFSNGTDVPAETPRSGDDGRTLVFLGAMDYRPNEDAVLFFVEAIFPLIKQQVTNARLIIAGKSPSAKLAHLHDGTDILVQGYVQDRDALFAACTVFVVPIRIGGGTRIKILDAMAAGKPVVATSVGAEGLEVTPGVDILIGDSAAAFAEACADLLGSSERRETVARAGRALVAGKYRWETIRAGFAAALQGAAPRSAGIPNSAEAAPAGAGALDGHVPLRSKDPC